MKITQMKHLVWTSVAAICILAVWTGVVLRTIRKDSTQKMSQSPDALATGTVQIAVIDPQWEPHVSELLGNKGISSIIDGSIVFGVRVPREHKDLAVKLLREDTTHHKYWAEIHN